MQVDTPTWNAQETTKIANVIEQIVSSGVKETHIQISAQLQHSLVKSRLVTLSPLSCCKDRLSYAITWDPDTHHACQLSIFYLPLDGSVGAHTFWMVLVIKQNL